MVDDKYKIAFPICPSCGSKEFDYESYPNCHHCSKGDFAACEYTDEELEAIIANKRSKPPTSTETLP